MREFYQRWNPYMKYTINSDELRKWYEINGANAFFDGKLWSPRHRILFGVRNAIIEVWFEETTPFS